MGGGSTSTKLYYLKKDITRDSPPKPVAMTHETLAENFKSMPATSQKETWKEKEERKSILREWEEIDKYRQAMNFPAEVSKTINNGTGSGGGVEDTASMNKGSNYNRNSKRGTRLVRSR